MSVGWVALLGASMAAAFNCIAHAGAAESVWVPTEETSCKFTGWAIDRDPRGINVRAAPSSRAAVRGTLPPYVRGPDRYFGVELDITGSHNGWLRIEAAKDDSERSGRPPRATYSGAGWVHGSRVMFAVQSGAGYARPDMTSQQLVNLGDDWLTDMGKIRLIVACNEEWALVEFEIERRRNPVTEALEDLSAAERKASRRRAWFRGICWSQETTCDGVHGILQRRPSRQAPG
jgi:hypothetical protein